MEDDVDRFLEEQWLGQVVVDEDEVAPVLDVLDVVKRARVDVVDTDDAIGRSEQVVAQVRAEEPRPAGYESGRRGRLPSAR